MGVITPFCPFPLSASLPRPSLPRSGRSWSGPGAIRLNRFDGIIVLSPRLTICDVSTDNASRPRCHRLVIRAIFLSVGSFAEGRSPRPPPQTAALRRIIAG